jgi:hypothetical protein
VGRKKREKNKKKQLAGEKAGAVPEKTTVNTSQPDPPDLSRLSGDWQKFYQLVIDRVSLRQ